SLAAEGGKCRPVCVTWRRLITAGAMRQWLPRLEEVNREVRQFGVAVPGGVEHVGLSAGTTRDGQLAPSHGLLQRLQHRQKDGGARKGGKVCASAHAVSGQGPRHKTRRREIRRDDRLLQRCPEKGPRGAGNVLPGVATGVEAIPTEN
ncbi:unnamed protein product, partial [Laminaria digitata]